MRQTLTFRGAEKVGIDPVKLLKARQGALDQTTFAARIGISKQYLTHIYNGRRHLGPKVLQYLQLRCRVIVCHEAETTTDMKRKSANVRMAERSARNLLAALERGDIAMENADDNERLKRLLTNPTFEDSVAVENQEAGAEKAHRQTDSRSRRRSASEKK